MAYNTGSLTSTGSVTLNLNPSDTTARFGVSGTYATTTFVFEASLDGTNFAGLAAVNVADGSLVTGTQSPADNTNYQYDLTVAGFVAVRLRVTAIASGTVAVVASSGAFVGVPPRTGSTGTFGTVTASGAITSTGTGGVGYSTGAGGTVTQATNKSTGVTLNKTTGAITLNNASLADATTVSFTVTNSTVGANDVVLVNHRSAGTAGAYIVQANNVTAGAFNISVRNVSGGSLGEAIVVGFDVLKGAVA